MKITFTRQEVEAIIREKVKPISGPGWSTLDVKWTTKNNGVNADSGVPYSSIDSVEVDIP